MKFTTMLTVPAFLLGLCAVPLRSIGKPSPDGNMARMGLIGLMADTSMPSRLGSVSFNISCKPQVKAEFNRMGRQGAREGSTRSDLHSRSASLLQWLHRKGL